MIIGKSLTAIGGGGLKPEIRVTAKAGALLNLHYNGSSIILQSYQLSASETQHTFSVDISETTYIIDDVTNGKSIEVFVDTTALFDVEISYNRVLNGNFESGFDNWSFVGTGSDTNYWMKHIVSKGDKNYLRLGVDLNQTYTAQQVVNFTDTTVFSFDASFLQGYSSNSSFTVYIDSTTVYSKSYNAEMGKITIPVSYSGNHTIKFMVKKTNQTGLTLYVDITDVCVY